MNFTERDILGFRADMLLDGLVIGITSMHAMGS